MLTRLFRLKRGKRGIGHPNNFHDASGNKNHATGPNNIKIKSACLFVRALKCLYGAINKNVNPKKLHTMNIFTNSVSDISSRSSIVDQYYRSYEDVYHHHVDVLTPDYLNH